MMDVPLIDSSNTNQPASPGRRLAEARWLLVTLAVVFVFFSVRWPDSGGVLVIAYLLLCFVIAISPRKQNRMAPASIDRQGRQRSIWPETQVRLFVNAIPEPSVVLDGEGIVRHANGPMRDIFGSISEGDPLTLKFRDPDIVEALSQVQATGEPVSVTHMVRFPMERHYLIHFAPILMPRAGGRSGAIDFLRPDFIFLMMTEQTERFRVDELRSDFIANVSHELRTPVASLTGFIETLLGPARDDEESRERFLKIMLEQAQRMTRLVNDLLSLSRIEMRSHVRPTDTVDLSSLVSHVVDAMGPLADEANMTINVAMNDGPFWVTGDKDELVQVFQNLVENACKYGSDGEYIDISVDVASAPADFDTRGRDCFVVSVQDYGKGIPSEHLPRLTERFYRIDAEESKRKMGTGLGLAVVKHILMRHQAHLKIESTEGKGACFRVYLISDAG